MIDHVAVADAALISHILRRKRAHRDTDTEVDLRELLKEIILWADKFVPSASGSILLDDPVMKYAREAPGRLHFVACFGPVAEELVGTSLTADRGIVGETYLRGEPYFCDDVSKDPQWFSLVDESTRYKCRSIICVPIQIDTATVGVIELINREENVCFDEKDFALLKVFAGYTATLIQNALDARRFEELSKTDYLTGMYNYQFLFRILVRKVREARKTDSDVSVVFFDLDYLKQVNDTYGHLVGSRLLIEVGDITKEIFGGFTSLMARYGGDEYVVLLPGMSLEKAGELAEQLRVRIQDNTFLSETGPAGEKALNLQGRVSCSVGVASLLRNVPNVPDEAVTAELLTKASDKAMYRAKENGKNQVVLADSREAV